MPIPARTALHTLPSSIKSSYPIGAARSRLVGVSAFGNGADQVPKDVYDAICTLDAAVASAGGDFRVTDCRRSVATQSLARSKYVNWLNAGKPSKSSSEYNPKTMKNAFVAKPGFSFHNAGRAIDIDIASLGFSVPADKQLDRLWDLAIPLGWSPAISAPDEKAKEAWHFDFFGEWAPVKDRLGYKDAAMCAALDIGIDCYGRDLERLIQSQLHRAGYDVGEVDGYLGAKTAAGLDRLGLSVLQAKADPTLLFDIPSSTKILFSA
jgi:hypothetical protein